MHSICSKPPINTLRWLAVALVLLPVLGNAQEIADPFVVENMYRRFADTVREGWDGAVYDAAVWLFWSLATISLCWTMGMMVFRRADFGELFAELVRFIIFTGLFFWLLDIGRGHDGLMQDVLKTMNELGQRASGDGQPSAASLLRSGYDVFLQVAQASKTENWPEHDALIGLGTATAIVVLVALSAVSLMVVKFTLWILAYGGLFLLGFGGSRWTSSIAINYYKHVLAASMSWFVMLLLAGTAQDFLREYSSTVAHNLNLPNLVFMLAACIVVLALMVTLPRLLAGVVLGAPLAIAGRAGFSGHVVSVGASAIATGAGEASRTVQNIYNSWHGPAAQATTHQVERMVQQTGAAAASSGSYDLVSSMPPNPQAASSDSAFSPRPSAMDVARGAAASSGPASTPLGSAPAAAAPSAGTAATGGAAPAPAAQTAPVAGAPSPAAPAGGEARTATPSSSAGTSATSHAHTEAGGRLGSVQEAAVVSQNGSMPATPHLSGAAGKAAEGTASSSALPPVRDADPRSTQAAAHTAPVALPAGAADAASDVVRAPAMPSRLETTQALGTPPGAAAHADSATSSSLPGPRAGAPSAATVPPVQPGSAPMADAAAARMDAPASKPAATPPPLGATVPAASAPGKEYRTDHAGASEPRRVAPLNPTPGSVPHGETTTAAGRVESGRVPAQPPVSAAGHAAPGDAAPKIHTAGAPPAQQGVTRQGVTDTTGASAASEPRRVAPLNPTPGSAPHGETATAAGRVESGRVAAQPPVSAAGHAAPGDAAPKIHTAGAPPAQQGVTRQGVTDTTGASAARMDTPVAKTVPATSSRDASPTAVPNHAAAGAGAAGAAAPRSAAPSSDAAGKPQGDAASARSEAARVPAAPATGQAAQGGVAPQAPPVPAAQARSGAGAAGSQATEQGRAPAQAPRGDTSTGATPAQGRGADAARAPSATAASEPHGARDATSRSDAAARPERVTPRSATPAAAPARVEEHRNSDPSGLRRTDDPLSAPGARHDDSAEEDADGR